MRSLRLIAASALAMLLFGSCRKERPAPALEDLPFPVVILFGNASTRLCQRLPELTRMHSNYLNLNEEAPVLIDSDFNIYSLDHFRSVHGGLWLMAHPSEATDVTFELKGRKPGREKARALFVRQLQKQTWRDDSKSKEQALARSQNLLQMVQAVQSRNEE